METTKFQELCEHAMLPEKFWDCRVSEIPDKPYKRKVEEWVLNFKEKVSEGKGLYIFGKYGRGKSGIGSILVQASIAHHIPSLWLNFKELQKISIKEEKSMFNKDITMFERAQTVDFLIIDEVQVKSNLHWPLGVLDDLVRYRHQNKKPTVITSNVSPDILRDTPLTKSLASILSEAVYILLVEGKNFREKN